MEYNGIIYKDQDDIFTVALDKSGTTAVVTLSAEYEDYQHFDQYDFSAIKASIYDGTKLITVDDVANNDFPENSVIIKFDEYFTARLDDDVTVSNLIDDYARRDIFLHSIIEDIKNGFDDEQEEE